MIEHFVNILFVTSLSVSLHNLLDFYIYNLFLGNENYPPAALEDLPCAILAMSTPAILPPSQSQPVLAPTQPRPMLAPALNRRIQGNYICTLMYCVFEKYKYIKYHIIFLVFNVVK